MIHVIEVKPIGVKFTRALVTRQKKGGGRECSFERVELPSYPAEDVSRGEALRSERVKLGLSLLAAAAALELEAADVSRLERGAATLSKEDWAEALLRLTRRALELRAVPRRFR